jgi:hypothetical protein
MVNQLRRQLGKGALLVLLSIAGCGKAPLVDDQTGFIDLVPFYRAGATTANPNAGLPLILAPKRGWVGGTRIEYYDFGTVGHVRKRDAKGSEIRDPAYANVFPMYFFFDAQGRPMFSKPVYDVRTGIWRMVGGSNPANPTPVGAPTADPERKDYYGSVYLRRPREVLYDDDRASSNFQRPVIDVLGINGTTAESTGLWEVVEITVNDGGYQPDAIKSGATVRKGISDGRLSERRTGKVINCPVVDERTNVLPSSLANNIPRPRVQVWYRTRLGECYLVNGWETLGEAVDENQSTTAAGNLRLFGTDETEKRVATLDAFSYSVGTGQVVEAQPVTAAVGKLYIPTQTAGIATVRFSNDDLALSLPRHKASDPGGYSPIAWLWDLNIPPDSRYQPGSIRDLATVDQITTGARDAANNVFTNNIAIIGAATKCIADADCKWGMTCNRVPDETIATSVPDPGLNFVDMMIAREGGPRCDVPAVGYGQYCSLGTPHCDVQAAAGGENDKRLKAIGVLAAGPTFTVHATQAAAQTAFDDTTMLSQGVDPKDPTRVVTPAEQATALAALTGLQNTLNAAKARVAYYDGLGYTTDYAGYGYFCYPPLLGTTNPPTLGGFCHIRCDSGASSTAPAKVTVDFDVGGPAPFSNTFEGEARCGGLNLLGYKCLPTTAGYPERQRVCQRVCNVRNTLAQNAAICDYPLNQKPDANGNPSTSFSFSDGQPARAAVTGQMCFGVTSTATCNWNAEFEPRDPVEWTGP